ncbi:MAG: nitronate monooxygenase [Rhizobiaceae bacterium]|nr:nitronate monooxygenase [Rhizobiaceae bacterium]
MLTTRLTEQLGIAHPVISAPMATASGGELAAVVTQAGGLGMIGGGYGKSDWIAEQFGLAGNQSVGCGFITWALEKNQTALDETLERSPAAVFLSFGDPAPYADQIKASGTVFICQVQTVKDAKRAIEVGADIVVAQGNEAGGHSGKRATFTLVPEIADAINAIGSDVLLVAAGGIGDGRGLAASLMLGADGVLVGTRFWASDEALVHENMLREAVAASGDDTLQTNVMDVARELDWPERYLAHALRNKFTDQWHGNIDELKKAGKAEADKWTAAWAAGDTDIANTMVGEATGLISSVKPAAEILESIVSEATDIISNSFRQNVKQG